jgi:hypothetical protein
MSKWGAASTGRGEATPGRPASIHLHCHRDTKGSACRTVGARSSRVITGGRRRRATPLGARRLCCQQRRRPSAEAGRRRSGRSWDAESFLVWALGGLLWSVGVAHGKPQPIGLVKTVTGDATSFARGERWPPHRGFRSSSAMSCGPARRGRWGRSSATTRRSRSAREARYRPPSSWSNQRREISDSSSD